MNILALTPDQLAATGNAWITAGVGLVIALTTAAAVVLPKIAALKAQVEALNITARSHDDSIKANTAAINAVALATPTVTQPVVNPTKTQA